jgi:hypothetical protein
MLRTLVALTLLMMSGCSTPTVRAPKPQDASNKGKSEKELLEERLGI